MDTLGLVWAVAVTAASVQDRDGALRVLSQMEAHASRLKTIYADGNYAGGLESLVAYLSEWTLEIVRKPPDQKGFAVLPKRWIVERTFAWLGKCRRLSKDYEFKPQSSEAMIQWAMVHLMTKRLAIT